MKTNTKRIQRVLSALLCLAMMLSVAMPVFAEEVQHTDCYVGGVEIVEENAVGDGVVSYNLLTKTLTLKNVHLTECDVEDGMASCIYAKNDLTIRLEGENSITVPDGAQYNYGIYAEKDLTIQGSGSLTVQSGDAVWTVSGADDNYAESAGIYVEGDLTISGATVTTKGGSATVTAAEGWTGNTYAYSEGIWVEGSLYVKNGATVDSSSSYTSAVKAYSRSIVVRGEEMRLENAVVTSTSGDSTGVRGAAEGQSYAYSRGVSNSGDLYVSAKSVLKTSSGKSVGGYAHSYGISSNTSEDSCIEIDGTLVAQGNEAIAEVNAFSLGVLAWCDIQVNKTGSVEATAGKAQSDGHAQSSGIEQYEGKTVVHGGSIKAAGNTARATSLSGTGACSFGITMADTLLIDQGGSVVTSSEMVYADDSQSTSMSCENLDLYDGTLTAIADEAEGNNYAGSYGIYTNEDFHVYDAAAVVTASTADAKGNVKASSLVLVANYGDVIIEAGKVDLMSGTKDAPDGNEYAIFVPSYTAEDGVVWGGHLSIGCTDAGLFGLKGTKLTATGGTGVVYAAEGIELGENVTVEPKNVQKVTMKGIDVYTGETMDVWTFADAEGEQLQSITVERTAPYKTFFQTLNQKMQSWF